MFSRMRSRRMRTFREMLRRGLHPLQGVVEVGDEEDERPEGGVALSARDLGSTRPESPTGKDFDALSS